MSRLEAIVQPDSGDTPLDAARDRPVDAAQKPPLDAARDRPLDFARDERGAEGEEAPETGRSLIRVRDDRGHSLSERLSYRLHRLAWRTPLHRLRLRGRAPLRLLAVPKDPVAGDKAAGEALLGGHFLHEGTRIPTEGMDFATVGLPADAADYLQSFAWLRDLSAAATRERAAKLAEGLTRAWLAACGAQVGGPGWRPDLWGARILFWTAYAPYILSSRDAAYRGSVLQILARGARHLDRSADRAHPGLPRIVAWSGVIAAALLVQGGPARLRAGEAGLTRALESGLHDDGGLVSRAPFEQLILVETLSQLRAAYMAGRRPIPEWLTETLALAASAMLAATLGDDTLGNWQAGNPASRRRVLAALEASASGARPARRPRGWGYHRLQAKNAVLVFDGAPPPPPRAYDGACASTLAFEYSDGRDRLIVNCGGAGAARGALPAALAFALRTTAAHSTLTLGDRNSTAIHEDGSSGRGVGEVELGRDETAGILRVEASHDGYARRFGLIHERRLVLAPDGRALAGEDRLYAAEGRRRRAEGASFAVRFHLAPAVEATITADGRGALLRMRGGAVWQFRGRGGALTTEDSLWIDGQARPHPTQQLVISGETPGDGMTISWEMQRVK